MNVADSGRTKNRDRDIVSCARVLQSSNETAKNRAIAYFNRGVACKADGDGDRAIADYTEAIRLDPKLAIAYYERGIAYHALGDFDRAIADYTEAIRLDPKLGPNNERVIIKRVFAAKNAARAADVRHICSEKYQTAKAAGTLNSGTWPQFYSKCTAEIKAHPPTAAAPPLAPVPLPRAEEAPAPPVAAERTAAERAAAEAARLLQLRRDTEVLARADFNQRKLAAVEAERLAAQRQHAAAAGNATHDLTEGPRPNNGLSKITKLGEMLQQLPIGHIFLAAPKTMKVSEVRSVEARVGINVPMEILRQQILAGGAQTVEGSLRTSSEMIATLSGPGFKITATTPEQQSVAEGFPTGWEWNVEAMQDGDQELTATLCAGA